MELCAAMVEGWTSSASSCNWKVRLAGRWQRKKLLIVEF
jgi:hypothetical protein